jgi:hypothetical protein
MLVENATDQRPSRCCKGDVGDPAILWASLSADESLFFETIDSGGNRPAGEHDAASDGIHRERAFVEKDFQDGKVRNAKPGGADTSGIELYESPVGLHENEPKMDAGSVGWAGVRFAHVVIFISRYLGRKIFFAGKQSGKLYVG